MKNLIVIIAIVVAAQSQELFNRPCRSANQLGVKTGFRPEAYLGVWWEIERYEQRFQRDADCVRAQYTLNPNGTINVLNQAFVIDIDSRLEAEGLASISFPNESPLRAMLNVTFGQNQPNFSNYWVLATDYTNYAFVVSCVNLPLSRSAESYWLLSRSLTIAPAARESADKLIQQHLEKDKIRITEQDNVKCGRLA